MNRAAFAAIIVIAVLAAFLLSFNIPRETPSQVRLFAPAVLEDGTGAIVPFTLTLRPGTGRMLVDIDNAFFKQDVENSLRKARVAASSAVGASFEQYDIEVGVVGSRVVSGESAGALFTVGIASLAAGRTVRSDVIVSATVSESGALGVVDGIDEKIAAAADAGKTLFIVAAGQEIRNEESLSQRIRIERVGTARDVIELMLS
ncbi:hypothetical protein AUJ14_04400 [Candidatus Micrarchaeota archaeon CG1_02_55_22]|nr:MAG: hypothetical protein AUJ14_04400 [Candidatus Micrarchaeota archaeon CG1_02_55_22]